MYKRVTAPPEASAPVGIAPKADQVHLPDGQCPPLNGQATA